MRDLAGDTATAMLELALEAIAAVALTLLGIGAELAGLGRLGAGLDGLTIWYLFMGALALYAGGYMLGYRTVVPQLRD